MPARTWTDEELTAAVPRCRTLTEVVVELGLRPAGGNHATVRRHIQRLGLSTEHFERRPPPSTAPRPLHEVLVRGSTYQRAALKRRLFAAGLKAPRCELCGQGEVWRGRRMALVLDHINGEHDDNRLENLQIVCPNCNATLDTFCGRRNGHTAEDRPCDLCGSSFRPRRTGQRFCCRDCGQRGKHHPPSLPAQRRAVRPPEAELRAMVEAEGFRAVGRRFGVSDNAIRKWLRSYEREREERA